MVREAYKIFDEWRGSGIGMIISFKRKGRSRNIAKP